MISDEEFEIYNIGGDNIYLGLCENSIDIVHKIKYQMYIDKTNPKILQHIGEQAVGVECSMSDEEYKTIIENRKYAMEQIKLLVQA